VLTLNLDSLTVARGTRVVVSDVSLAVPSADVTALLGPNGAGKSTLVLAVAGLLQPLGGRVLLDGHDLARLPPERIRHAGVAVVPEGRHLLPNLTVAENLRVATYALNRDAADRGIERALELFPDLRSRWRVRGRYLSGGEQQMLVLAQAIVSQPRFLLVDELSLGLAPVVINRLVPVLARLACSGVGVLLIEQFAQVALRLATTAYILESGRIRYHGWAAELRTHPDLLHSAYLLPGRHNS
jgi:branched-chain amino acid transport system ATP-binding protein